MRVTVRILSVAQVLISSYKLLDVAGCTSGFVDLERLAGQTVLLDLIESFQYLYPDITFTCNGSITSWSVLVHVGLFAGSNGFLYPNLQLWRKESDGVYTKVGNTTLSGSFPSDYDIYQLDSPLEFQAGDIFGIFQPPTDQSQFILVTHRRVGNSPTAQRIGAVGVVEPPYNRLNLTELDDETRRVHILISVSTGEYF